MWDYSSKKNCMWAMVGGINLREKKYSFFFLRKKSSPFINVNELHLNTETKQYEVERLPSKLGNLVCI